MSMLTTQSDARPEEFSGRTRTNHPVESLALFLGILLLFTVVTTIFLWQWIPYLHSALIGPPEDNMQDFWNTWRLRETPTGMPTSNVSPAWEWIDSGSITT